MSTGDGFPRHSVNIVMGLPGSGKTVLAEQLAFANGTAERPALYLTTLSEPLPKLAARLRRRLAEGPPLIVALTGFGSEEARERSREAGFAHHLVKPVDPDQLTRLLAAPEAAAAR